MKIQAAALVATASLATAKKHSPKRLPSEVPAASDLGRSLLSQSRRLDGEEDEESFTWIAGYSLKFQGCRHHAEMNFDADDDEEVKVKTIKLAHFKLCPSGSCSKKKAAGCTSNYGDYVVDLATFAKTYVEGQKRAREYECKMYMYETCNCQENDDKDDGFNRDYCEYDCYAASKDYSDCIDRNPYEEDEGGDRNREFEAQEYAECKEWEVPEDDDDNANGRKLEEEEEEEEEDQYFIGPYCSDDGSEVYLGLYTDDTCTNFADSNKGKTTYKTLSKGEDLPYSSVSLVSAECVSCIEQEDPDRRDENDGNDDGEEQGPEVSEQCEQLYESAGKCESSIDVSKSGMTSYPSSEACQFIEGLKYTSADGIVHVTTSKAATFWAVVFGFACVGLAAFAFQLKKKVEEAQRSPLLEKEDSQEDRPALA